MQLDNRQQGNSVGIREGKTMSDFTTEAQMQLLRKQLAFEREKHVLCAQRMEPATKIIEAFMQLNFPVLHGQAKATGMDLIAEAQETLRALRTNNDLSAYRYDTEVEAATTPAQDLPESQKTTAAVVSSLSAEAIAVLQILGSTADYDVATIRWARERGHLRAQEYAYADLERMVELRGAFGEMLTREGLAEYVEQEYVPTPAQLRTYQSQYLIYLTEERGVPEYRARFGSEPVHRQTAVEDEQLPAAAYAFIRPQTYPSEECWWWTRTVKTLIELGGRWLEGPFTYQVSDPVMDRKEGSQQRYSYAANSDQKGSEPDLIVVMHPRGGQVVRVVIEFERANYPSPRLKNKIWKNLRDYRDFDGIYYIAPTRTAERRIQRGIRAIQAIAKQKPSSVEPGIVAVFRGMHLEKHWLPSPAQVDRWGTTPPERYNQMALNSGYYKHRPRRS